MLFTPRLFALNGAGETETLRKPALIGQSICVVPRAECSFRRVRLAGRGREARQAAQLKARNEALPGEDGSLIITDAAPSENAGVAASNLMAGIWGFEKHASHKGRYLPETLAQVAHDDGARLVRGLSGFEGQIWTSGNLAASRWWGRAPGDAEWDGFIRAAQETLGPLDMPRPAATEVPWRDDISVFDIGADRLSQLFSPANTAIAAATLFGCFGLYISGQYLREGLALNGAEAKTAELRGETEQIQSERRRALTNMSYVRRYRALGDNGTVLAGFGAIANVMGTTDLGIARASLRGGSLELRLGGEDEISVPDVVSLLEAQPNLSNVSVSLESRGTIIVKADIAAPSSLTAASPGLDKGAP